MPKIDLTGREIGDFVVLREADPIYNDSGKKKLRWVCECKTCHEKEIVLGESIRKNYHRFCTVCLHDGDVQMEETIDGINKTAVALGYKPITKRQFINAMKFIKGNLAPEDESDLPEFVDKLI